MLLFGLGKIRMSEMGRQGRGRGERGDELVLWKIIYVLAIIP